tara:strand:- start:169 stop:816 length:648 start_codon:yes stop_codon:yes gene_type:complete
MAENKKSFVAYCDWQETFEELSDEEAGKLVKHLFNYVNDKNPETSDKLTKMCFIPIKQSLKRDLKKYEKYVHKQSVNGKKGGRPKNPTLSQKTQPFIEKPKKADSVSVSVSDTVITIEEKEDFFIKASSKYKMYAEQLFKDKVFIEALSRNQIKDPNKDVCKNTIHKYLKLFLSHLDEYKHVHDNKKQFSANFSNWLRKQKIVKVYPEQKQIRYS